MKQSTFSDRLATYWMNTNSADAQSAVYALPNLDLKPDLNLKSLHAHEPVPVPVPVPTCEPRPTSASYTHGPVPVPAPTCEPRPGPTPTCEPRPAPASYTHEHGPGPTYEPRPAPGPTTRPHVSALHPTKWHSDVTTENLSQIWNISLETAQKTLQITTQFGMRSAIHPITRCYHMDHLHYNCHRLNTTFYTDGL